MTGADMVLATLVGDRAGRRRSFAAGVFTKTTRIGWLLAEVGAILAISYIRWSRASSTGFSSQTLWVRASRKSSLRSASVSVGMRSSV